MNSKRDNGSYTDQELSITSGPSSSENNAVREAVVELADRCAIVRRPVLRFPASNMFAGARKRHVLL